MSAQCAKCSRTVYKAEELKCLEKVVQLLELYRWFMRHSQLTANLPFGAVLKRRSA